MALTTSGGPGVVPGAACRLGLAQPPAKGAGVLTDQAAIERFQALYAEHHARVYAYAVSRVGRQLADEVVSEVFLVAWRRLADVPTPALPWLLTVARNTASSQFRGSARQRSICAEMRAWMTEAELSEPAVADSPEHAIADPSGRAVAGPPERAATDSPGRAVSDLPGRASADCPDAARLGHPVLAHREERSL